MKFRIRHLRMRAITAKAVYGADIRFGNGLNVLWADNTRGKSTCMQGMLYVLGLERMLSPRREIPLPHAMTSYLNNDDQSRVDVLESYISLEVENAAGEVVTITRAAKAKTDPRLITVDFGAALTEKQTNLRQKNFFVLDPGAAQREDGFHFFLENFIGWELPKVRRYDAPETKLYLETVFPLFWVEQKFGWSTIPAAIPTYMRIREVQKRAVEFIMDLDVHRLEIERERLTEKISQNAKSWASTKEELVRLLARGGGRIASLSDKPTADKGALEKAYVEMTVGDNRRPLDDLVTSQRQTALELANITVPLVDEHASETAGRLASVTERVDQLNVTKIALHGRRQLRLSDIASLRRRISTLGEDLQKNLDVQKLQRYSGTIESLTPDRCPTCEQALADTLLSQEILEAVMPISENIEYIRSQKKMFEDILARELKEDSNRSEELSAIDSEISQLRSQIRTLRAELIAPGSNPSAAAIEERIVAEARVRELEGIQIVFSEGIETLSGLQSEYIHLLDQEAKLSKDKLSAKDRAKFARLTQLLQAQTSEFGFSTFPPSELAISEDSYRPEKEGYEIGFETSASDAIRLKWAYQLGLLELAADQETNHPNLLVFDEPRQQSSSKVSFESLLRRAQGAKERGQQVIFSTSEDLETLRQITSKLDCEEIVFQGYILQELKE